MRFGRIPIDTEGQWPLSAVVWAEVRLGRWDARVGVLYSPSVRLATWTLLWAGPGRIEARVWRFAAAAKRVHIDASDVLLDEWEDDEWEDDDA